jgi:SAM-dependent methyltransferase
MQLPFELDALAEASHYQRWVFDAVQPYLGRRILEVGSGIGNMSQWLPAEELLVLTETEPLLLDLLRERVPGYFGPLSANVRVEALELGAQHAAAADSLAPLNFDTVISFNVLEHIEDDKAALTRLIAILRASPAPVRRLVSFVPAQPWALSDLDRHYGHFRRYGKRGIQDLSREIAPDAELLVMPFNALGLLGWVWSTMILKQTTIDRRAVKAYDSICRHTRGLDDLLCRRLHYPLGQSFVWVLTLR